MTSLSLYLTLGLSFTSLTTLLLGLSVYFYKHGSSVGRIFLLYCLSISWWSFFQIWHHNSPDKDTAVLAARLMTAGGSFLIPSLFVHFVHLLLNIRRKWILRVSYTISFVCAFFSITSSYMIADATPRFYLRHLLIPGPLYSYAVLFFVSCIGYGHYELYKAYSNSFGFKKNQLAYLFWSSLLGYTGGSANFLMVFDINIPLLNPFGTYAVTLYVAATTYAIARYRLMDITVVFHKGLAYGLLLTIILAPAYLVVLIGHWATVYAIPSLLAGTLVVACGLWIVLKHPRSATHLTFGLVCFGVSIWLFGFFMIYSTTDDEKALFWGKFIYLGVVYIPAFFYHFCASFLGRPQDNNLILTNYLVSTAFLLLIPTSYLINGQYVYFWGLYPRAGVLHPLFLVYFTWVSGLALQKLYWGYKAKKETDPLKATRIKYIFWAFAVGYIASIDFAQTYGLEFYPLGFFFVSLWISTVSYAIVKHQLLDISVITKIRARPYARALTLITLFYFVTLMLIRVFTGSMEYLLAGILIITLAILAESLEDLRKKMEKVVGQALFKEKYNAYETLTAFSKTLVTILDLKSLTEEIIRALVKVIGIRTASLYLLNKEKNSYILSASYGLNGGGRSSEPKLNAGDGLPHHLASFRSILVREELEHAPNHMAIQPILSILQAIESDVCIPFINKDRLIGFCNLGPRTSHQMYSQEDLNLLTTLAQNAAIALDNAMLYEDFKRSQTLMRRTDRLRSLETIAGGFAHEVRNPLTSIKTFIQLAPERKDDAEFMGPFSEVVLEDVHRIERLIKDILDYARYMDPKFMEDDLNDIVESCLHFMEIKADNNFITIERHLDSNLPRVKLDRQQIKQVLMNLLLNAIDAMGDRGGRLTVQTHLLTKETGNPWVQVEVTDTGSGIDAENLDHIFDPFYTTKQDSGEREGTGLGLTIVHQIVQEHHGYIDVKSEVGRGTTFFVNLPVIPTAEEAHEGKSGAGRPTG